MSNCSDVNITIPNSYLDYRKIDQNPKHKKHKKHK